MPHTAESIAKYITDTFTGVSTQDAMGYTFFSYNPGQKLSAEQAFPFATLIAADNEYDKLSNLNRDGVYRLNVGASRERFQSLIGDSKNHDYTALDRIMPHPDYAAQSWVCVLNPDSTWATVQSLLADSYQKAVDRYVALTRDKS